MYLMGATVTLVGAALLNGCGESAGRDGCLLMTAIFLLFWRLERSEVRRG